jgi:hypothetical protein
MGRGWVRLLIPNNCADRQFFGESPYVISESPRGIGREVRLATDQETGMFGMKCLPGAVNG